MSYVMVCNVDVPPVYPEVCPADKIQYIQNFWDSGLTLEQTSVLVGAVVLLWATAYAYRRVANLL